jgi:hypothetical protein
LLDILRAEAGSLDKVLGKEFVFRALGPQPKIYTIDIFKGHAMVFEAYAYAQAPARPRL